MRQLPRIAALIAALLLAAVPGLFAQGGAGDRNKAQPYYDPPRQATVTSFSALNGWVAALLDGIEKPAPLFYGNARLRLDEMGPAQTAQLGAGTALIVYGGPEDRWILDKLPDDKKGSLPIIRLHDAAPDDTGRARNTWLDTDVARKDIAVLARELSKRNSGKADVIAKNAEKLNGDLDKIDATMKRLLEPYRGSKVFLERPGMEPFFERYGIGVAGYLTTAAERDPSPAELTKFREALSEADNPVFVRAPGSLPIALLRITLEVPMRSVLVDPMTSGEATPGHYVVQMKQNAVNLALALKASKTIAAAFTPMPTPVPGTTPIEEEEVAPDESEKPVEDVP